MDTTLLLFDRDNPYWNSELLALAGKDTEEIDALSATGMTTLTPSGNLRLTEPGMEAIREYCREYYLPVDLPCYDDVDESCAVDTTKFHLLFERGCMGRWSLKEYFFRKDLEYFPSIPRREMYRAGAENVEWLYGKNSAMKEFLAEYPHTGFETRKMKSPDWKETMKWLEERNIGKGTLKPDILFLSRYDFEYYAGVRPDPNDRYGFLNADRMFCFDSPQAEEDNIPFFLDKIGAVHMLMLDYSRIYLPGYTILDTADQDNLNWIVWITKTEDEADRLTKMLGRYGQELIPSEIPMYIYALSHEELASMTGKEETVYDLLFYHAHTIAKPD